MLLDTSYVYPLEQAQISALSLATQFLDKKDGIKRSISNVITVPSLFTIKGKTSIKKVLPVLVPSLSYKDLGIAEGLTATIKWFRAATWTTMSDTERLQIFNDLTEYCELDTLAMVEIFNALAICFDDGLIRIRIAIL